MPFVTAGDETELHYEVEGEGFPLVFTHGNMGFGQQFFLQTRVFSRQFRCVLHDSRGCGLSGKPTAEIYDTKTQAADLYTILRAVGVEKSCSHRALLWWSDRVAVLLRSSKRGGWPGLYRFVLGGPTIGDHGRASALPI